MSIVRNPSIYSKKIEDKWIILETNKEYTRELNDVAGLIWELIESPSEESEIISKICQEYSVSKDQATKDFETFTTDFIKEGFIIKN